MNKKLIGILAMAAIVLGPVTISAASANDDIEFQEEKPQPKETIKLKGAMLGKWRVTEAVNVDNETGRDRKEKIVPEVFEIKGDTIIHARKGNAGTVVEKYAISYGHSQTIMGVHGSTAIATLGEGEEATMITANLTYMFGDSPREHQLTVTVTRMGENPLHRRLILKRGN